MYLTLFLRHCRAMPTLLLCYRTNFNKVKCHFRVNVYVLNPLTVQRSKSPINFNMLISVVLQFKRVKIMT